MLKLARFNSTIYSFNKKTWVLDRASGACLGWFAQIRSFDCKWCPLKTIRPTICLKPAFCLPVSLAGLNAANRAASSRFCLVRAHHGPPTAGRISIGVHLL